jgi:hypothetical protein
MADVEVVECALMDEDGQVPFEPDGADGGRLINNRSTSAVSKWVRTERLSKYLREETDLVKMDIEGAEGRVLTECSQNLAHAQRILIEYHSVVGRREELSRILSILEGCGYDYCINSDGNWRDFSHFSAPVVGWLDHYLIIYAQRGNLVK